MMIFKIVTNNPKVNMEVENDDFTRSVLYGTGVLYLLFGRIFSFQGEPKNGVHFFVELQSIPKLFEKLFWST